MGFVGTRAVKLARRCCVELGVARGLAQHKTQCYDGELLRTTWFCTRLNAAPGLIPCRQGAATALSKLLQNIFLNIRKKSYLTRVFVAWHHGAKKVFFILPGRYVGTVLRTSEKRRKEQFLTSELASNGVFFEFFLKV